MVRCGTIYEPWYEWEDHKKEQRRIELANCVGLGEEFEDYIDYCSEIEEEYSRNFGEHRRRVVVRGRRIVTEGGESEEDIQRGHNEEEDTRTADPIAESMSEVSALNAQAAEIFLSLLEGAMIIDDAERNGRTEDVERRAISRRSKQERKKRKRYLEYDMEKRAAVMMTDGREGDV